MTEQTHSPEHVHHEGADASSQKTEHDDHSQHGGHGSHAGHEKMFRDRFWVSLVLSIPVLIFSPALQEWLGYTAPTFPGSTWITPLLAVVIFSTGGLPFLQMATGELREKQPGILILFS